MQASRPYSTDGLAVNQGWVAISRQLLEHPVVGVPAGQILTRTEAWIWLIQRAAFEEKKAIIRGEQLVLLPGELAVSIRYLAKAWRWTPGAVRWFLDKLARTHSITKRDTGHDTLPSIIKLNNYSRFRVLTHTEQHNDQPNPLTNHDTNINNKQLTTLPEIKTRAREGGSFWRGVLNPPEADYSLAENGELALKGDTLERWRRAFGGDAQRLQWALTELAGTIQPNSARPLATQIEAGLARIAGHKRERDQRYAAAVKNNPRSSVHATPGGVRLRDTAESVGEYTARMIAEGKYRP